MKLIRSTLLFSSVLLLSTVAHAQETKTPVKPAEAKQADIPQQVDRTAHAQVVSAGVNYLLNKGQDKQDGSFSKQLGPAVTAMCTTALLRSGLPAEHPKVAAGLKYIEGFIKPDGGIYAPGSTLRNYETSISVMCFKEANVNGKYDKRIEEAVGFLKKLQWDSAEGHSQTSQFYGGQGYGNHKRPDASNTSFFVDALQAAGEDPNSDAMQKALKFMSRCQNLNSPNNGQAFTQKTTAEDRGGSFTLQSVRNPKRERPPKAVCGVTHR